MNKFTKYTLISIGLNLLLLFLIFMLPGYFVKGPDSLAWGIGGLLIFLTSLAVQLITGLYLLGNERQKIKGQAMLLCVGLFLLVGFSICGGFA